MFDETENRRRLGDHAKDPEREHWLDRLNERLRPLEEELAPDSVPEPCGLFVLGLPRSGTTLTYQLLAHGLAVGYPNNIIARFWRCPLVGIRLSRMILGGERSVSFSSTMGRTPDPSDPHEFGYFWTDAFGYEANVIDEEPNVDWSRLVDRLGAMNAAFGRPLLFKNLVYAFHLGAFASAVSDSIFVVVERDRVDTAVSILETRRRRYGDEKEWWSVRPPAYDDLVQASVPEQIAGQMRALEDRFASQMNEVSPSRIVRLRYDELCRDPGGTLDMVRATCRANDLDVDAKQEPPAPFDPVRHPDHPDAPRLRRALSERYAHVEYS